MKSLKELYRIGKGPSSSHTIGPERACFLFASENPTADRYKVILFESLAKTGEGHGTDTVVKSVLKNVEIVWDTQSWVEHPNTMDLYAYQGDEQLAYMRVYSVGGGAIRVAGRESVEGAEVYPHNTFADIRAYCEEKNIRICDYAFEYEGEELKEYLRTVWETMKSAIARGVAAEGVLPGGLEVQRRAKILYEGAKENENAVFLHFTRKHPAIRVRRYGYFIHNIISSLKEGLIKAFRFHTNMIAKKTLFVN